MQRFEIKGVVIMAAPIRNERHAIHILDRVLSAWEDFWFVYSLILANPRFAVAATDGTTDRPPMIGALTSWQRFRRFLLNLHQIGKNPFARSTYEAFLPLRG
jgi:hypothetical protein